jgi:hypothetical protein
MSTMAWIGYGTALIAVMAAWMVIWKNAVRSRRMRLAMREAIPFDEWYHAAYGDTDISMELVADILRSLADCIGVAPTQLRPQDRFTVELAVPGSRWLLDDSLADFEAALPQLIRRYHAEGWKPAPKCESIDAMIRSLHAARKTNAAQS